MREHVLFKLLCSVQLAFCSACLLTVRIILSDDLRVEAKIRCAFSQRELTSAKS